MPPDVEIVVPVDVDGWHLDPVAGPVWVRIVPTDCSQLQDADPVRCEALQVIRPAPMIEGAMPDQLLRFNVNRAGGAS